MNQLPTPYVFLSYAGAERARALVVADALEQAGIRVWLDREAIAGGTSWGSEIVDGIAQCAALLICCTPTAMQSRNVKQEIQLAWRFEKPYLPLLLEPVEFPPQVLYFLEGWQWVEAANLAADRWLAGVLKALARFGVEPRRPAGAVADAIATPSSSPPAVLPPTPVPDAAPAPLAVGRATAAALPTAPFVGRERELVMLRRALGEALAGRGRLVLLAGEPGIGKTRLAEVIADEARERGAAVLWGRCWEGDGAPAYFPWVEIVRAYLRLVDPGTAAAEFGAGRGDLAQLAPDIRAFLPDLPALVATEPEAARFRLFEAVVAWLHAAGTRQPLLLVLDDLHWADKPSLLLLQFLVRDLARMPLLILGTYRDVELDRTHPFAAALGAFRREEAHERLSLQGLSGPETEALVAAVAQQELQAAGTAFAALLHRETEGNPFFLQETLRHLVESGKLVQQDGRWVGTAPSLAALGVPEGIKEVVGRRLSHLSREANQVLAVAAVVGREFPSRVLEDLAGATPDVLDGVLEEAEGARLIAPVPGAVDRYRFTHALVRETLYDELPLRRRVRLHRQAGEALEALYARTIDPHVAELAYHFGQAAAAGDPEKAIAYAVRAGDLARQAFGYEAAVAQWRTALELIAESGAVPEVEAGIYARLGRLLHATQFGDTSVRADALQHLEQAVALYEQAGALLEAAELHQEAAIGYGLYGPTWNTQRLLAHAQAAEAILSQQGDETLLWRVRAIPGLAAFAELRTADGLAATTAGLALAVRRGRPPGWAGVRWWHGELLAWSGRVREGLAALAEAWQEADRVGEVDAAWLAAGWHDIALSDLLDYVQPRLLDLEASSPRQRYAQTRGAVLGTLVALRVLGGQLGAARAAAETFVPGGGAAAALWFADGDWDRCEAYWREQVATSRAIGNRETETQGLRSLARAQTCRGHLREAQTSWSALLEIVAGNRVAVEVSCRTHLAVLLCAGSNCDAAREHLARCRLLLHPDEGWHGLPGQVAWATGALAATEGHRSEATAAFAEAVETFRRYRVPWQEAETELAWAGALRGAGDLPSANRHYEVAAAVYQRIGAGQPWLDRVERLQADRGAAP